MANSDTVWIIASYTQQSAGQEVSECGGVPNALCNKQKRSIIKAVV